MAEQLKKRSDIEEKYKWKLEHIYPTDEAWEAAYNELSEKLKAFAAYDGKVAENPRKIIREFFELMDEL